MRQRRSGHAVRAATQAAVLGQPAFPTTTIGSFPQTAELRHARAEHDRGHLDGDAYTQFLPVEPERAIRWQEEVGRDMRVHGEIERNEMVQYWAEVKPSIEAMVTAARLLRTGVIAKGCSRSPAGALLHCTSFQGAPP